MFRCGTFWALDYALLPTCVEKKFFFVCDIYLFVLACTLGYNEFDFVLENEEYRPFAGDKIEI
jgi:hypothetical protein